MVSGTGQTLPHQVPPLPVGPVAGQQAPALGEAGMGLHQVADPGQGGVRLQVHLRQLGRLHVPPGLGEGAAEGRPPAMGGQVRPLQGRDGRIGGGPPGPARGAQAEEVCMGQCEGPQGGFGVVGLEGELPLGHPVEGVRARVDAGAPGGIAFGGRGCLAAPAHPHPVPGGMARRGRQGRPLQVFLEVGLQGGGPPLGIGRGGLLPEEGRQRGFGGGASCQAPGSQGVQAGRGGAKAPGPGPQAGIQHPAAVGQGGQPGGPAMGRQIAGQRRQDQGFGVGLEGGPGQTRIQRALGQQTAVGVLAPQEEGPPVRRKVVQGGRHQDLEKGRQVEGPFRVRCPQQGDPPQPLRAVQEDGSRRHPGGAITLQQGLPGVCQQLILPDAPLGGGGGGAAVAQQGHPGRIGARGEGGGLDGDPRAEG